MRSRARACARGGAENERRVRAENDGRKGKKRGCFFVRGGKMRARSRGDERSHSVCVPLRRALCKHRARGESVAPRVARCRG